MENPNKTEVLIVDNDGASLKLLGDALGGKHNNITVANDGESALDYIEVTTPDIVLLNNSLPPVNSYDICSLLKSDPTTKDIPIILLMELEDMGKRSTLLALGVVDYIIKPIDFLEVRMRVNMHLGLMKSRSEVKDQGLVLNTKLDERTKAHAKELNDHAREHLQEICQLKDQLKQSTLASVKVLVGLIEGFDSAAGSHVRRVYTLSKELGEIIGLTKDEIFDIEVASLLHELGKFCIPDSLRFRSYNKLKPGEIELIKQQTVFSQNVLLPSKNMHSAGELIRSHLERYDGSGFPDGIAGEEIPLGARVIGAANAYDTLINSKRFDSMVKVSETSASKDALDFMKKSSGTYYDPKIILHLDKAIDDISRRHGREIRVSVESVTPGYVLSRNIYTSEDKLLLSKDVELTNLQIEKLKTFHYARQIDRSIYVYTK